MSALHKNNLIELMRLFLKLGTIAFGGPAAHIGMMEEEVVRRRRWMTRDNFLDLVGATNLIPGPNSTEMAIHIGYIKGGIPGLIVSGLSFILPAVIITGILAWVYVSFGSVPQAAPLLLGIKPAVISVILVAVVRLGKTAAKDTQLIIIGVTAASASLLGTNEVLVLLLGGAAGVAMHVIKKTGNKRVSGWIIPLVSQFCIFKGSYAKAAVAAAALSAGVAGVSSWKLGLFFLKVGAVLYGSGYVLVAFIEGGLVKEYGWLTHQQLLDAIAIGQFTPGPVLSTATFVGYLVSGVPGAIISTIAIFLPSFIFVLMLNPVIPRLRSSKMMSAFLDAVNISAIALMAAVVIRLSRVAITDWRAVLIAVTAMTAGLSFKVNAAWLIMGGAVAGFVLQNISN